MPKQNGTLITKETWQPHSSNTIPTNSDVPVAVPRRRRKRDDTADMIRLVRQDIQHLANKLSDYERGYYFGCSVGHTAGVHWIVNHAEEMMMHHFKVSSRDELVTSDKYPSWWSAMLVDLIKKSPPKPEPPAQAVSLEK